MRRHTLALTLALALAGCSRPSAPVVAEQPRTTTATTVAVDPAVAHYQQMVEHLASPELEGRNPGTAGAALARDWLVEQFRHAGLEPAFGDRYTQPFEVTAGVEVKKEKLHANDKPFADSGDYDPFGTSASAAFAGEAVFVGYSIDSKRHDYHSYPKDQADALTGKVFCVYRYEPTNDKGRSAWTADGSWTSHASLDSKIKLAERHGAAAIVVFNPPARRNAVIRSASGSVFGGARKVPIFSADYAVFKQLLKRAGKENPEQFAKQLEQQANVGPAIVPLGVTLSGEVELKSIKVTAYNIAAALPGRGALADQVVVVGAHYDHLGFGPVGRKNKKLVFRPGADDNASGTAALVQLAQRFAARAKNENTPAGRRAILFVAFDAEERGLIGSKYFAKHLEQASLSAGQITAMLNMDMVGRLRNDRLFVSGVDTGDRWRKRVSSIGEAMGLQLVLTGPAGNRSDHSPFHALDIPVLHLFTGLHADYHQPTDTADKINAAGGVRVVAFLEQLMLDLWAEPVTVAFVAPSEAGPPRAFLGIRPRMTDRDGKNGAGIDAITPGGPAQKAGLLAGDVIVGWDGKTVNNTTELMQRIGNTTPGDEVELTVERGKETVDIKVKTGKR